MTTFEEVPYRQTWHVMFKRTQTCFVRTPWSWLLTTKIWSIYVCARCKEVPHDCFWYIMFTRTWGRSDLTYDHQILLSSFLSQTEHFHQIYRNVLKVFMKYRVHKNKKHVSDLIKLLPEADRFGDGVRYFLGQLLLLRDVLYQVVHFVNVPETLTTRRGTRSE